MPTRSLSPDKSVQHFSSPEQILLNLWFSLPEEQRSAEFVDSRTAAQLAAVSQRTIRAWIESGQVLALRVGKKYQIRSNCASISFSSTGSF